MISLVVFMLNITTNRAIPYKNYQAVSKLPSNLWAWTKLHTKMVTKATERRLIEYFFLKIGKVIQEKLVGKRVAES